MRAELGTDSLVQSFSTKSLVNIMQWKSCIIELKSVTSFLSIKNFYNLVFISMETKGIDCTKPFLLPLLKVALVSNL